MKRSMLSGQLFGLVKRWLCACFLWVSGFSLIGNALAEDPASRETFDAKVSPFLQKHCVRCHGGENPKGDLLISRLSDTIAAESDIDHWEMVLERVSSGEMPPEGEPQPSKAATDAVVEWIESGMQDYVSILDQPPTTPHARRLTNFEYQNTIRDLIGFELNLIDRLSKDPVKPYQFNNTAALMRLGPEQVNRYLECARMVMASAIVDPQKPTVHRTYREFKPHGVDKGLGLDEVGVWGNRRHSPATGIGVKEFSSTGEYRIRIKAAAILPPGVEELPLRLVMGFGINVNSATEQIEPVGTVRLRNSPDEPQVFEFRGRIENHPAKPGRVVKGKQLPASMTITPQNLYDDGTLNDGRRDLAMPRAVIEWIEMEVPVVDVWPPTHHTQILFDSSLRVSDPRAYVRQVLKRFMSRAYRRPANQAEVERFLAIHDLVAPELGSMEAAMRETLAMVLVSPQFLYHTTAADDDSLRGYEQASKLSYFLWGSMPDQELFELAADGRLGDQTVVEEQVRRMLADERASDFVDNFATQWLSLRKLKTVPVNRDLFPRFLYYVNAGERRGTEVPYRPTIRDHMHAETVGFVGELIRRNASVLNLIDSDFAYLNQPLAAHYGVDGVKGDALRPVSLTPDHRLGGLLTQGAILIGNGTGTAPHPIYRAVWLREAILGDAVPAPPAEVPALNESVGESAENALTIAELLQQHRKQESCNDCHTRLDPWGIPFEQYNAIGRFQPLVPEAGTRVSGFNRQTHHDLVGYNAYLKSIHTVSVDAKARLPGGFVVDGMRELKDYLLHDRQDEIVENVLRRLLSYAIGRELTWRDRFAVAKLLENGKQRDYKFQDLIVLICNSKTFRGE
ncbi:MAG: DUF1592 domain-containing protein [Rubripirellula sp.]|nr:DUF1592 domain-containing protein [Rubripirellula sp.]